MAELKVWGDEKPKVGQYFIAYGRYDDEPSLCKMEKMGAEHCSYNWTIEYMAYGEGGTMESELSFTDETRWHYVATKTPDWQAIVAKMIDDGVKV